MLSVLAELQRELIMPTPATASAPPGRATAASKPGAQPARPAIDPFVVPGK